MTKAEELKVLEKIDALIKSAGEDSYIAMTFKGVVDIARNNIENDFGDIPVEDLAAERERAANTAKTLLEICDEHDALRADFAELSAAYREAVQAVRAATSYAHAENARLYRVVDALAEDAPDDEISRAVREQKRAKSVVQKCSEVLNASLCEPMCSVMAG